MKQAGITNYKPSLINYNKTKANSSQKESKLLWRRINATDNIWYYNNSEKHLTLDDFLIQKHQFILTPKCYTNGFICISLDGAEIWHNGISKKRTKIDGNLEMWINTFKNI